MDYGYQQIKKNRGFLVELHIADLHFGAMDPEKQYNILMEQFYQPSLQLQKLDIIAIDGDIFDHRVMSNSDVAMYATKFIDNLVHLAEIKNATLVIIAGTYSHDYDQLKLFYHYMNLPDVDVRVVTTIKFEEIKGARILCLPELYGVDESVYDKIFHRSGYYDVAFCHGTFEGAVYGNNVGAGRLLTANDFDMCKGLVLAGHVHKPGCFEGFYYYCGCPYRWKFGEEEQKGFLLVSQDLDTERHYVEFKEIFSDVYRTIYLDELVSNDPKELIDYIDNLKIKEGIDFIKVRFRTPVSGPAMTVMNNYYRNMNHTFVEFMDAKEVEDERRKKELQETEEKYNYLLDPSISDFERFVMYVNNSEGEEILTVDKLKELLSDKIDT